MQILTLIWGILAIASMAIGFLPFMSGLNYYVIPFAALGLVAAVIIVRRAKGQDRSAGITAIVLCGIAVIYAVSRFAVGFGVV